MEQMTDKLTIITLEVGQKVRLANWVMQGDSMMKECLTVDGERLIGTVESIDLDNELPIEVWFDDSVNIGAGYWYFKNASELERVE